MTRTSIAILKLIAFIIWTTLMVTGQLFVRLITTGKVSYALPYLWHKGVCSIFKIKVITTGTISKSPSTLYISNHISWLDIPVIGSQINGASFVAKRDVESWPVFGFLSKLQQTAFIDRSRNAALKEKNSLKNRIETGHNLILFPEGTSSKGVEVLPFKSSLFEILRSDTEINIQPFCISIQKIGDKNATTQILRDIYAWYGDMTLPPHLWEFAKSKGATISLYFHEPLVVDSDFDRKTISKQSHMLISQAFQNPTK